MSHRLWFRLDDVLPIAEHAMACPAHTVTGAQALAQAPTCPALVWTGTPTLDILVSNGAPTWFGQRGTTHAAEAHTWRHTPTGRYGTAYQDNYHSAYLPLDTLNNQPSVIDVLRQGRDDTWAWVSVDIDPADRHLIRPHRVRVLPNRDQVIPPGQAWVPATVTCPSVAGAYPALVPDRYTSDDGDDLPRFDRHAIERIVTDLDAAHTNPDRNSDPMPGEYPILRWSGDVVVVFEDHETGTTISRREADQVNPDADGRYPLGAFGWHWQRQPATPAER
jgi:hypothetical protein